MNDKAARRTAGGYQPQKPTTLALEFRTTDLQSCEGHTDGVQAAECTRTAEAVILQPQKQHGINCWLQFASADFGIYNSTRVSCWYT